MVHVWNISHMIIWMELFKEGVLASDADILSDRTPVDH